MSVDSREGNVFRVTIAAPSSGASAASDSVAIEEPGLYVAQAVHWLLEQRGVRVVQTPRLQTQVVERSGSRRIAELRSVPFEQQLAKILKESNNLYAETLMKGTAVGSAAPASYATALRQEKAFHTEVVGVAAEEFFAADASGLSVENMVSPKALVKVVRHLSMPERRGVFHSLLAIPLEQEGTLRRRFPELVDRLRAKTGTIDGVDGLAGYVTTREGAIRYFAILVNHHATTSAQARGAIDRIVAAIAEEQ